MNIFLTMISIKISCSINIFNKSMELLKKFTFNMKLGRIVDWGMMKWTLKIWEQINKIIFIK